MSKTPRPLALMRVLSITAVLALLLSAIPLVTTAAPAGQGGSVVYYVRPGDTLFSISRRFGTTVPALMAANGLVGDTIYAGQRLIIPVGGYYSAPVPAPTLSVSLGCSYIVQPHDTLFSIAYRYQTTVAVLMQANNLLSPDLYAGQPLTVPCLSPSPAAFPSYVVQPGDNLFRIAIRFNTTVYEIALANHIPNPALIFAGQTLVIPYPGSFIWPPVPTVTPTLIGPTATATLYYYYYYPTSTATPTATYSYYATAPASPTPTATTTGTTTTSSGACTSNCVVVMRDLSFEPQTLAIVRGTTVTWMNIDTAPHLIVSGTPGHPDGIFQSPQIPPSVPAQTFTFTFNTAGTYPYYDQNLGAQMTGTIIVQ